MGDDFLGDFDRLKDEKRPKPKPFWRHPLAIGVVVAIVLLAIINNGGNDDPGAATEVGSSPSNALSQFSWSVTIGDATVILKGDKPNGYPTETWADGELLDRDESGDFAWDTQIGVPTPVAIIQSLDSCAELIVEFDFWIGGSESAPSRDSAMRQLAFAQAANNRSIALGCP